jgi:hypothetical protein
MRATNTTQSDKTVVLVDELYAYYYYYYYYYCNLTFYSNPLKPIKLSRNAVHVVGYETNENYAQKWVIEHHEQVCFVFFLFCILTGDQQTYGPYGG